MKKILLFLAVLILFCLLVGGCMATQTAEDLASSFASALSSMNFAEAHACLWDQGDSKISQEEYVDNYQYVVSSLGVNQIEIADRSVSLEDNAIYLSLRIRYIADRFTLEHTVRTRILQEDGAYHIQYSPEMILPGYSSGNQLSLISTKGQRGEIFTADHTCVAENAYSDTVVISVAQDQDINAIITALSSLVSLDEEEQVALRERYNSAMEHNYGTVVAYVAPKDSISQNLEASICAIDPSLSVDRSSITPQRYYPYGSIYAHVVGYAGTPNEEELEQLQEQGFENATLVGKTGIELQYDEYLQPKDGLKINMYTEDGQYHSTIYEEPAETGADIFLTLSHDLQQRAYYAMSSNIGENQTGIAIVMDPTNAFVQAMISYPSFDANIFSFPVSDEEYAALNSEEAGAPLFPKATLGLYPPGSLLKPFTITPSLENGVVDADTVFPYTVTGNAWKPDGVWYWDKVTRNETPDGPVDLEMAFRFSDNIYFSWATLNLGQEKFLEYMNRIGLKEAVPFDLPTAQANLINEGTEINRKLISDMAFGHGEILVTPIQAAAMYTVFQNGGDMLAPKLVESIRKYSDGLHYETLYAAEREVYIEGIMTQETVDTLIPCLRAVVRSGTAQSIQIKDLPLAAKTGTALRGVEQSEKVSWLAAWWQGAQQGNRLVVTMIDSPRGQDDYKHAITKELLRP